MHPSTLLVVSASLLTLVACGRTVEREGQGGDGAGASGSSPSDVATTDATTGTTTSQGGGGAGGGGSVAICAAPGPCGACVALACPEVWCACVDDPECGALFACSDACGTDEACRQACLAEHPDGISDVVLVSGCAAESCPDECPQTGDGLSDCEECLYTSCDAVMNTCLSQPACLGLFQCLTGCPDLDLSCQQGCYASFGDGAESLEAVLVCAQGECPDVCET
jgi:hypothetical protein